MEWYPRSYVAVRQHFRNTPESFEKKTTVWKEHWVWVTGTQFEPQLCLLLVCSLKPPLHLRAFFFLPCKMGIIVPMLCFEDVMK